MTETNTAPKPIRGTTRSIRDFEVEIIDPRSDPEPSGWAKFCKITHALPMWDYSMLRLEAWLSRNPPVLALIREGGRVVGACSVMLCSPFRGQEFSTRPAAKQRPLRPGWAEVYLPLYSGYPAVLFRNIVDAEGRRIALREFERELARYVGLGLMGVVYRAMSPDIAQAVAGPRRMIREIDPTMVLPNRFDSPDEWAASLRPEIRSTVRECVPGADIDVTTGSGRTDLDAGELTGLLNEHRARMDARAWRSGQRSRIAGLHLDTRSPVATAYLGAFLRRGDVVTRVYRDADRRLLAFNAMIDNPDGLALHYWAAVPANRGGRRGLYVDAYVHAVRRLVETGRAELTAGRTLLDLKAGFGFTTRTLMSVAVPRPVMGR